MANLYLEGLKAIHDGTEDLLSGTIRVLLLTNATSPAFDETHSFVTQVLGDAGNTEATDASYTGQGASGRLDLGSKAVSETAGLIEFVAAKSVWTALDNFTVAAAVVFIFGTGDADSQALSFHDFADKAANGSDFEVRWNNVDGTGRVFSGANA